LILLVIYEMSGQKNFGNIKDLAEELERQKINRYDLVVPSNELIVFTEGNKVYMTVPQTDGSQKNHDITEYCHSQISWKTGIPMKYYKKMMDEKPELLSTNINAWLPTREKRLVRVLDNEVRALLSDRYRIIDNYDVAFLALQEFKKIADEKGFKIDIRRSDLTDRHLYIKVTSPDLVDEILDNKEKKKGDKVNGGIIISNSEVGSGCFKVTPFVEVLKCSNGLIGDDVLKKVHVGRELGIGEIDWSDETLKLEDEALWSKMRDMIHATFDPDIFHKWVDKINGVAQVEIEKPTVAVSNVVKHFKIPDGKKDDLLNQFAKESPTQWGLSMAVTRIAQDEEDYEKQIELEKIGNDILNMDAKQITVEA